VVLGSGHTIRTIVVLRDTITAGASMHLTLSLRISSKTRTVGLLLVYLVLELEYFGQLELLPGPDVHLL
jgi:hypothetical protein